MQGIELRFD